MRKLVYGALNGLHRFFSETNLKIFCEKRIQEGLKNKL